MVLLDRIELPSLGYKARVMPLYDKSENLVDRKRIELLPPPCKGGVLPLSLTAQVIDNFSYYTPSIKASQLVPQEGFEPSKFGF